MASRVPALALIGLALVLTGGCSSAVRSVGPRRAPPTAALGPSAFWNSATIYFLLPDRFQNDDPRNDRALGRAHDGGLLRNFEGGDLAGVQRRIDEGYFDSLGVNAIWMTPFVEQIHGSVDEGSG
jgi:alpha-amylase